MKKAFNYRETISLYDEDVHECGNDIQGIDLVEEPPSEEEDNDNNADDNQSIDSDSLLKMNCTLIKSVVLHKPSR